MRQRQRGLIVSLLLFLDQVSAPRVALYPYDSRGTAVLDELGRRLEQYPQWREDGARVFRVESSVAAWGGLETCLDAIEPAWRDYVERLALGQ